MRQWLFETLRGDSVLQTFHEGRVYQNENMTARVRDKLFLVYTMGNATNENIGGEDPKQPQRQFFTIYVHDVPGDYMQIDDVITRLRALLTWAGSKQYGIIQVRYLETSSDMDDSTMGTIMKYVRFQAIKEA